MKEVSFDVHCNELTYFTMSGSCTYLFTETQILNTFPAKDKPGYLAVSKNFDKFFIGTGKHRSSSLYDWKSKFHCNFQRFSVLGTENEQEEELFRLMKSVVDLSVYDKNKTTVKVVNGIVSGCRDKNKCPCSYKLEGSQDIYQVPAYEDVADSFFLLNKGDSFEGLFEYRNSDCKLIRILYAKKVN